MDISLQERISERCSEDKIRAYGKNKLIVDFPFIDDDHGYNLLLSYGEKSECLEPENIRQEMKRRIHNMASLYSTSGNDH